MMELYDIITLSDDKKYVLIKELMYDEDTYYLLNEVDDTENILDNRLIVRVVENGFKTLDEDEYKVINELFVNLLLNGD